MYFHLNRPDQDYKKYVVNIECGPDYYNEHEYSIFITNYHKDDSKMVYGGVTSLTCEEATQLRDCLNAWLDTTKE